MGRLARDQRRRGTAHPDASGDDSLSSGRLRGAGGDLRSGAEATGVPRGAALPRGPEVPSRTEGDLPAEANPLRDDAAMGWQCSRRARRSRPARGNDPSPARRSPPRRSSAPVSSTEISFTDAKATWARKADPLPEPSRSPPRSARDVTAAPAPLPVMTSFPHGGLLRAGEGDPLARADHQRRASQQRRRTHQYCVDPRGFEPRTFSLRTRRATNCAMGPGGQQG